MCDVPGGGTGLLACGGLQRGRGPLPGVPGVQAAYQQSSHPARQAVPCACAAHWQRCGRPASSCGVLLPGLALLAGMLCECVCVCKPGSFCPLKLVADLHPAHPVQRPSFTPTHLCPCPVVPTSVGRIHPLTPQPWVCQSKWACNAAVLFLCVCGAGAWRGV